jgi:mannan endo-1,4-beta-mannosidase
MKSRLIMSMSLAIAALSLIVAVGRVRFIVSVPTPAQASIPPKLSSYLGVFEAGSPPSYGPIAEFAAAVGRKPSMAGYWSGWAEPFKSAWARELHTNGVIPFVQIDPTDASVGSIASGVYDQYLDIYADAVRNFGHAVVIGFGQEMNAPGYSWGYGHVPPRTFVAAWRHLVTVFRQQGADNVTWLWTIQAETRGTGPIQEWWPGRQYVTWVGIDGFYYKPSDTFSSVFGQTISKVRSLTSKPILLAETAVGPKVNQVVKILDLFRGMASDRTLGLVWFDIAQNGGSLHQDWRIENSPTAVAITFRTAVSNYLVPASPPGG